MLSNYKNLKIGMQQYKLKVMFVIEFYFFQILSVILFKIHEFGIILYS